MSTAFCFAQSAEELESPAVNRMPTSLLLPVRLQDEYGLPHGSVSLPHLLGEQEKDFQNGAAGMSDQAILAFRPGNG